MLSEPELSAHTVSPHDSVKPLAQWIINHSMISPTPSHTFSFDSLKEGKVGISVVYGSFLAEAAAFCLYENEHHSPGRLLLTGNVPAVTSLHWNEVGAELSATWADLKEAAEYGAYGIAIVVCVEVTKFHRVERSAQEGTGIDIWLTNNADDRGIFQRSARLEVSGILHGDQNTIAARLKQKLAQTERSDQTRLPAYVVIVEFGTPEARLIKRSGGEEQQ